MREQIRGIPEKRISVACAPTQITLDRSAAPMTVTSVQLEERKWLNRKTPKIARFFWKKTNRIFLCVKIDNRANSFTKRFH